MAIYLNTEGSNGENSASPGVHAFVDQCICTFEKNKQVKAAFDRAVALGKKKHKEEIAKKEAAERKGKR